MANSGTQPEAVKGRRRENLKGEIVIIRSVSKDGETIMTRRF